MIEIIKNLGEVEPLKLIVVSVDITNDSSLDATFVDITSDENLYPISDYTGVIIPAQGSININYNLITTYNNFLDVRSSQSVIRAKFGTNITENIIIKFNYNLSYKNVYLYLFKINNIDFIKKDLVIIIEYLVDDTGVFDPPDLSIIKMNTRKIILSKKFKINKYIMGYFFTTNDLYKKSVTDTLFAVSSKKYFKIKDLYIKII